VFWGISAADEQAVLLSIVNPCKQEPLELSEIEIDEVRQCRVWVGLGGGH
jgi:hypothetical protein